MPLIESKLNNTRNLLQELGNSVSSLVNSSPDVFDDLGIQSCLQEFLTVHQEAVQRLENPSFRIATLGTTSSGKSTIVNALIGRKIAPIEAGEMSGGVLTIKHSQEQRLMIAETEDAAWDTGEWTGLSDEDLYQRIRAVMHSYHAARKKREYVAPQITAHVPLLPACDASLLGLPNGISVELIDLPGLKSVQDRANLATIQKQLNKAFSLVALDYMQVDDEHRKRLLEELKKVVEDLQGRTDSMIFILNRVDNRGTDDLPLSERIDKLREEIKEVLSLPELPDVLPFNARLLYYAQCAWGSGAGNEPSVISQEIRLKLLKAMFQDCAGVIKLNTKENRNLKDWFRDIEDRVDDNKTIDDETMRQILHSSLEWSGGRELWDRFRVRVQESFAELVILPALLEVFDPYNALAESLEIRIHPIKISQQEQVEQERKKIDKSRHYFHNIKEVGKEFKVEIEELKAGLKSDDPKINDQLVQEAVKKGRNGFQRIFDAVKKDIVGDLTTSLIVPVRDAFKNNQGAFELRDKLGEVTLPSLAEDICKYYDHVSRRLSKFSGESEYLVKRIRADDDKGEKELEYDAVKKNVVGDLTTSLIVLIRDAFKNNQGAFELRDKLREVTLPSLAEDISKYYDHVSRRLSKFSGESECLVKRIRADDDKEKKELEDDERYVRLLYHRMREAIFVRAEFVLQSNAQQFEQALESLVEEQVKKLKVFLTEGNFSSINLEKVAISNLGKKLTQNLPTLPENFFEVSENNIKQNRYKKTEVEYIELFLPSPGLMAKQWSSGIEKGKGSLWDILLEWILQRLDYVSDIFKESVDEITNLAERDWQQQSSIIEGNFEQKKQFWREFEAKKNHATADCEKLQEIFRQ
ncbi:dynamin family protein [Microcoleus sp. A2-C5]|uniref:dynamin family protein n=1 Tax=unclassified Microcoleus TaxID=2642155 RepID=UPI002FD6F508